MTLIIKVICQMTLYIAVIYISEKNGNTRAKIKLIFALGLLAHTFKPNSPHNLQLKGAEKNNGHYEHITYKTSSHSNNVLSFLLQQTRIIETLVSLL